MRWKGRQGSSNVEDRRGQSSGGGGIGPRMGGGGGNIIIMLLGLLFGRKKWAWVPSWSWGRLDYTFGGQIARKVPQ